MISEVIRFQDDTVMVLDEDRKQMSEFQGKYEDVRVKILAQAPRGAKFFHGWIMPTQGRYREFPFARKEW
jgi:hypothetical protein